MHIVKDGQKYVYMNVQINWDKSLLLNISFLILQRSSPDIKPALYSLLTEMLQNKWRYFFSVSMLSSMHSGTETVENEQQFIAIMQVSLCKLSFPFS